MPSNETSLSRQEAEDLLFFEAHLLDTWRLDEWLALLTDDVEYEVPATGHPDSHGSDTLALVYDDRRRLALRVKQYSDGLVFAEVPRSRVRRMISNVRVTPSSGSTFTVSANFAVNRFAKERTDVFIGGLEYTVVRVDGALKIKKRRMVLDHETLNSQNMLSFIL